MIDVNVGNEKIGQIKSTVIETDSDITVEDEMEYYMRRGNAFYFRNKERKLKIKCTDKGKEQLIDQLEYGQTINIEHVI